MNKKIISIIFITVLILAEVIWVLGRPYFDTSSTKPLIGSDRDSHGCLVGAGYTFDDEVGACIRAFEMTPDIKAAAALAVTKVGQGYALTVVSFNSYEEPGAYDIMFEEGIDRNPVTVYVRDGKTSLKAPIYATFYGAKINATAMFFNQSVRFSLTGVGTITLPQAISADGARYANQDESLVFWNKGNDVAIYKEGKVIFTGSTTKQ